MEASVGKKFVDIGEDVLNPQSVDWEDAPLVYKLMTETKITPLQGQILYQLPTSQWPPNTANGISEVTISRKLETLLALTYGVTRMHYVPESEPWLNRKEGELLIRRPVPSGGVLYPLELYLFVADGQDIPAGIYHYDVAHHALALLQEGDAMNFLANCVTGENDLKHMPYALVCSVFFWKNAYKYRNLGYRLQSQDMGVLLAQVQTVSRGLGIQSKAYFDFYDSEVADLIGFNIEEEGPYVIISLEIDPKNSKDNCQSTPNLLKKQTTYYQKSKNVVLPTELFELHLASLRARGEKTPEDSLSFIELPSLTTPLIALPETVERECNLIEVLRNRHSSFDGIRKGMIRQSELASYLKTAMSGFPSDIHGEAQHLPHVGLYCSIQDVDGIEPGIYQYDPSAHGLRVVQKGDYRTVLQSVLTVPLVNNIWQTSACFFLVGEYDSLFDQYGNRGYRLLNMEAGLLMQRLYLTASYLKQGCHTTTGFRADVLREILGLSSTALHVLGFVVIGHDIPSPLHHSQIVL